MVRGEALVVREQNYVALARVAGASHLRIILRHILPNVVGTIIVIATLEVGNLILVEASLSFLGVGVPPPTPAWGLMVADGRAYLSSGYWLSMMPGLAIVGTVLSINWIGDWLRDVLDPKRQMR
jgi:peptide/nickel transport system permease protein